jgi:hypothetical protein
MASFRSLLQQVLHLQESPHRTALAFALGVFITFSPIYGTHLALAGLCAWLFRLNAVALFAGVFVNNPWTLVPSLGATLWLGCWLTGVPTVPTLGWHDLSARAILDQVWPYAVPFLVGGFVLCTLAALASYPVAYWLIVRYRGRRTAHQTSEAQLPPSPTVR